VEAFEQTTEPESSGLNPLYRALTEENFPDECSTVITDFERQD
jgi:hypothetical protein